MRDWTIRVTDPKGQRVSFFTTWATKRDAMEYAQKLQAVYGPQGYSHEVLNRKTKKATMVY
jgi:hypothetical protein